MTRHVLVLDTQHNRGASAELLKQFPFLSIVTTHKEIKKELDRIVKAVSTKRSLFTLFKRQPVNGSKPTTLGPLVFVHYGDITDAHQLEILRNCVDVRFFSGAGTGNELLPRARLDRYLGDFLELWSQDEALALEFLKQPFRRIDRIRIWMDCYHHDYINLMAPLDMLAIGYVGGEFTRTTYVETRDRLLQRLERAVHTKLHTATDREVYLMRSIWEGASTDFDDPSQHFEVTPVSEEKGLRLRDLVRGAIIHVDDDIDKGWDLIGPLLFPGRYFHTEDPDAVLRLVSNHQADDALVLLDLGLQGEQASNPLNLRGISLLRQIHKRFPAFPVYAYTAYHDAATYQVAMEQGVSGVIHKVSRPFSALADAQLYQQFARQLTNVAYIQFRYHCYAALSILDSQLATVKRQFEPPASLNTTHQLLSEFLTQLKETDFERSSRDSAYAQRTFVSLILGLYRCLENFSDKLQHTRLLKAYRNCCAHQQEDKHDVRDFLIFCFLVIHSLNETQDLDHGSLEHLKKAYSTLFDGMTTRENIERDPCLWDRQTQRLLRTLRNTLVEEKLYLENRLLGSLILAKLNYPQLQDDRFFIPAKYRTVSTKRTVVQESPPIANSGAAGTSPSEPSPKLHHAASVKTKATLFRHEGDAYYINFGTKFVGTRLDPADPAQIDFFDWYYREHMLKNSERYDANVMAFVKQFLSYVPQNPLPPSDEVQLNPPQVPATANFQVFLFRLKQPDTPDGRRAEDLKEGILQAIAQNSADVMVDRHQDRVFWQHATRDNQHQWAGVSVRIRLPADSANPVVQLSPHLMSFYKPPTYQQGQVALQSHRLTTLQTADAIENSRARGDFIKIDTPAPLSLPEARNVVKSAIDRVHSEALSIDDNMLTHRDIGEVGDLGEPFLQDSEGSRWSPNHCAKRLKCALAGVRIGVIHHADCGNALAEMESHLHRTFDGALQITSSKQADVVLVAIPENQDDQSMRHILVEATSLKKPFLIVNPKNMLNKTWNMGVGLCSRIDKTLWSIRANEPETFFLGLDLGHARGEGSVLAGTLFDHQGRLKAWTTMNNGPMHNNTECITDKAFREIVSRLLSEKTLQAHPSHIKLMVHRDGKGIDNHAELTQCLEMNGIHDYDWLDIIKSGAPLFNLGHGDRPGQFILFRNRGMESPECWLRTACGQQSAVATPLTIIPRTSNTDFITLIRQIYDLSFAQAHDYRASNKLPITTYYADGFSSTGDKRFKFIGYEKWYVGS